MNNIATPPTTTKLRGRNNQDDDELFLQNDSQIKADSTRDHYQILITRSRFERAQNLSSGFIE